ncbi:arylsulfatase [Pseudozobellia thermophila]|nr:arylsulfatase [Pseudozobellia thermophila]
MPIRTKTVLIFGQWVFLLGALLPFGVFGQSRPNVILVLTDDQGIGDLGAHGNPWLKTPNIDAFYKDAVRLTNFHVSPLCTPTRAALMTGQYPIHNGAWATFKGRDALSNPMTLADIFKGKGYATAMFGKWHLGDNYPNRPTDSGFEYAIQHLSGGIGELSDYWGNDYFDDVYYVNNEPEQFEGYCTDVWFREAMDYIKAQKEGPFFVYLPLNAPHDPLYVDEKYAAPYRHLEGKEIVSANLYGMIANIDENFGKLTRFLDNEGLAGNTIVIYMSDNGTRFGYTQDGKLGYNKGFRGIKGEKLEGGHRVPFFMRWPKGNIKGGKDIDQLAAHVDVLPTLASLCNLEWDDFKGDGMDLSDVLKGKGETIDRQLFLHNRQDWRPPQEGRDGLVLEGEWRLIQGEKLYNIKKDPLQQRDVAAIHGERVAKLNQANARFYARATQRKEFSELPTTVIGSDEQKVVKLTIQHAIGEDVGIWKTQQVAAGVRNKNNTHALEVVEPGLYKISCMRWPKEIAGPVRGVPDPLPDTTLEYKAISPEKVRVSIANQMLEKVVGKGDESVDFILRLDKGKTFLVADFMEGNEKYGVYYLYLEKLHSD